MKKTRKIKESANMPKKLGNITKNVTNNNCFMLLFSKLVSTSKSWGGKSFFYRPAVSINSLENCMSSQPQKFAPSGNRHCFPLKRNYMIISPISRLLFQRNPMTIFFGIVARVINSVNLCLLLSESGNMFIVRSKHIIPKFLKRFPETFNAATSIIFKPPIFRITASLFNRTENIINSSVFESVLPRTPTTNSVAITQTCSSGDNLFSTITKTPPENLSAFGLPRHFNSCQFPKPLSAYILEHKNKTAQMRKHLSGLYNQFNMHASSRNIAIIPNTNYLSMGLCL